ncbi:MAG: class I SAM-dependent methyltransferase [Sphingomonas sp.]|uniref:class I SAM-dependent methyltransferase n=1 Tax=Sphingomonas sp. TaxID=28214 RepID=UPI0025F67914|nr:class I SAM-dependent methyltransferase [Sphingomonas sp.]MBY0284876.1 class I SAM-dependent methyltransferase [Sphingomonas sp.]
MNDPNVDNDDYFDHDQSQLLDAITVTGSSALEIGCATGSFLQALGERGYSRLIGIELENQVAERARARNPNAKIICGSIDDIDDEEIGSDLDLLVASHVLEHLVDPWSTLKRLVDLLRPGGQFIGAVPNIQHISVTVPLITRGRFEYQAEGILDRTHLRFFTEQSAAELLARSGLEDCKVVPLLGGGKSQILNTLTLSIFKPNFCWAFQLSGYKPSVGGL